MERPVWFESVFGSVETASFRTNRSLFDYDETKNILISKGNGKEFDVGLFETPSNHELKTRISQRISEPSKISFENITGDVRSLHQDPSNQGAVFQAASQFNCLEMVGPGVTPQRGITNYSKDPTQGPACALCCPAATVFRNYFVNGKGQATKQIDCLADVGKIVQNKTNKYWNMQNGYCLPCKTTSMKKLGQKLKEDENLSEQCYSAMRVGVHWDTEVSSRVRGAKQMVCQVFASALPVAYSKSTKSKDWETFACLVLNAAYDSTLSAAHLLALERQTRVTVFLTSLGGGAFGNRLQWIVSAIENALEIHQSAPLDVKLVHRSACNVNFRNINVSSKRKKKTKNKGASKSPKFDSVQDHNSLKNVDSRTQECSDSSMVLQKNGQQQHISFESLESNQASAICVTS